MEYLMTAIDPPAPLLFKFSVRLPKTIVDRLETRRKLHNRKSISDAIEQIIYSQLGGELDERNPEMPHA